MESLLYRYTTWTLGREQHAKLRTAHHHVLLRNIGLSHLQSSNHLLSYVNVLKKTQCEGPETIIRKVRLFRGGRSQAARRPIQESGDIGTTSRAGGNPGAGMPTK